MSFIRVRSRRVKRRPDPDDLSPAAEAELLVGPDPAVGSVFPTSAARLAALDALRARQEHRTVLRSLRVRVAVKEYGHRPERAALMRELERTHRTDAEASR